MYVLVYYFMAVKFYCYEIDDVVCVFCDDELIVTLGSILIRVTSLFD